MKIFLSRHGQSALNAQGRFSGQAETLLTRLGKKQARKAANFFAKKEIEAIFFSDLSRAEDTAQIIAKKIFPKPKMYKSRLLREISFGKWEGKKPEELKGKDAEIEKKWRKNHFAATPPNGESFRDLEKRVKKILPKILESKFENILIVSHSGTTAVVLKALFGLTEKETMKIKVWHRAVFEITIKGKQKKLKKIVL